MSEGARVPGAMQRSSRCFADRDPGFLRVASNRGPGSAAHRSAKGYALRCVRGTRVCADSRSRTCECIPIPVLKTSLILLASCPMRGRFPEAILQRTERKLAGPGRPGTVDGLGGRWSAGRRCALPWARAVALPREVGSPPASRVPIGALAPPTAPSPRAVREGLANLGRTAPREREGWLFEI
jgi:hypothetical protein